MYELHFKRKLLRLAQGPEAAIRFICRSQPIAAQAQSFSRAHAYIAPHTRNDQA